MRLKINSGGGGWSISPQGARWGGGWPHGDTLSGTRKSPRYVYEADCPCRVLRESRLIGLGRFCRCSPDVYVGAGMAVEMIRRARGVPLSPCSLRGRCGGGSAPSVRTCTASNTVRCKCWTSPPNPFGFRGDYAISILR